MRAAALAALALLAACFDPDYPVGLPCGADRFCPPGQACNVGNICVPAGEDIDAAVGRIDAAPADAGLGELLSIDIGPDVSIPIGGTHTFTVTATFENGSEVVDNIGVIWESSSNAIMFVDFMGVAHGESAGTATATADYDGRVDTAEVTVTPP